MEDEDDRPARPNGPGIWGLLTAIVAVLTLTLCGWYALIFVNPYSPLNPLPPATVTPYPVLVGPTPTLEPGVVAPTAASVDTSPTPNPTAPQSAVATLTPSGGVVQPVPTATTTGPGQPTVTAGPSPTGGAGPTAGPGATAEPTRDGEAYPDNRPTEPSNYP